MDLLGVMPGDLGEPLIWTAAGPGGFAAFKDHIISGLYSTYSEWTL